jgi:hypothetical protein
LLAIDQEHNWLAVTSPPTRIQNWRSALTLDRSAKSPPGRGRGGLFLKGAGVELSKFLLKGECSDC